MIKKEMIKTLENAEIDAWKELMTMERAFGTDHAITNDCRTKWAMTYRLNKSLELKVEYPLDCLG